MDNFQAARKLMPDPELRDRRVAAANELKRLHSGPDLLILANVWDAVSARVIVGLGAKAIATSSAAVAWSHGYPDGHALPVPLLLATCANIARVVSIPITADIEGGYSDDPGTVADTVAALIDIGVVGINLEDGTGAPSLLVSKIQAVRGAADRTGVPIFVNARTDVFLPKLNFGSNAPDEAIERANLYASAGADGIFVPGMTNPAAIERVAKAVPLPVNVMALAGVPPARELQRLGVRRLSAAAWLGRIALNAVRQNAVSFLATGDSDALAAASGERVDYNALFVGS
jgi:2-methylisocitrate lyase-like PEP mutase family enzyme